MTIGIRLALVGLVATGLLTVLRWIIGRAQPAARGDATGTISPDRISTLVTVLLGTGLFLIGCVAFVLDEGVWGPRLIALLGAAIAGCMAPSLTDIHTVVWSPRGVEGPSNLFGPTLGLRRTTIQWDDIRKFGTTITGYWYVQSADGRRVYWSYLYKGHTALAAALRAHCPLLPLTRARS